jgi:UDP-glucose 4-epimerase
VGSPRAIAITGLGSLLGIRLAERLLEIPDAPRIVGLDVRKPLRLEGRVGFHRVDLTDPTADGQIAGILEKEEVDVVVHLAFRRSPTPDLDADHELETIGSLHLMHACAAAGVRRLVVQSSTTLYGARPDNPNFLDEHHRLAGHPDAHCIQNRIQVEDLLDDWKRRNEDTDVCILRHCWVMGPRWNDHVVRYFDRRTVPVMLGYDPLLQFIHEEDLLRVFEAAALEAHPGVFNVVGRGVLPLSTLIAMAGKRSLPLPPPLLYRFLRLLSQSQTGDPPGAFWDYLRYLWVADGERGWEEFGPPVYSTREAWAAFVSARLMSRYR